MKRSLIQKPLLSTPKCPTANFPFSDQNVIGGRALKTSRPGPTIRRCSQAGSDRLHGLEKSPVNPQINFRCLQTTKGMGCRDGQGKSEIAAVKNQTAPRPTANNRKIPRHHHCLGIFLGIAEGHCRNRPAISTHNRPRTCQQQGLIKGHLPGRFPRFGVFP